MEMTSHLSDEQLDRYRDRMMSPAESVAANDHLAACDSCYSRFGGPLHMQLAYTLARRGLNDPRAASDDHPVYEQIAAYVDGALSAKERRALDSHLKRCAQCAAEVQDLLSLKSTLATESAGSPLPAKRLALRQSPVFKAAFQLACAAGIIAIVSWLVRLPLKTEIRNAGQTIQALKAEMDELRQKNARLEQELKTSQSDLADLKSRLASDDPSKTVENSRIVISLKDGSDLVTLDKQGNLSGIEALSPSDHQLVKTVLTSGRVKTPPDLARLIDRPRTLMGADSGSDAYPLLNPFRTVVMSERPAFRWRPVEGAASYIVSIYDSKTNEVATSQPLRQTEWVAPHPLRRGTVYTWQIRVIKNGVEIKLPSPDAPSARFKVIEKSKADALERLRQTHGDSHLVLGILYAGTGLLDDAERELELLVRANPQSQFAGRLLSQIKAARKR